ncbi:MAG: cell division protein FtsH, partial [Syntrophobacteraceae bacterium]|nr:cell division protein FtsH [Syntrophobacteraceae bacterium]
MAKKGGDQENPFDKFINRLKGSPGEGDPREPDSSQRKFHFSFWYFVVAMVLIAWLQGYVVEPQREKVPYSDFKQLVKDGKVENLVIGQDRILGETKDEKGFAKPFMTVRVEDPELVRILEDKNIRYSGQSENRWLGAMISWLLPLAILIFFWSFLIRRMSGGPQGVLSIGKARVKIYAEKEVGITFEDVAGIDEAKL